MLKTRVSIITRTKNRQILLRRALESVLGQTFQEWGLVIVNDGGEREQVDPLVEEHRHRFGGRVEVLHHPRSLGMEAASNAGLRASEGSFVVIHDDDDAWHPDFLSETVARLSERRAPSVRGVVTHSERLMEQIDGDTVTILSREPFNAFMHSVTLYRMAAENLFPPISFLYERTVLDQIGGYREDLPVLGDWELNLRFLCHFDIDVVPKPLAYYHHRVAAQGGEYANTVIGGNDKHRFYDALLRNELLRQDLAEGRAGLGTLVNQARANLDALNAIAPLYGQTTLFNYAKDKIWSTGKRFGLIR